VRARPTAAAAVLTTLGLLALARPVPAAPAAGAAAPVPVRFETADSVSLAGEWFPAAGRAPALVLAPRRRGPDPELRALATEFQRRGFGTLVFTLRDSAWTRREPDPLRYAVMTSRWVDDMVAALKAGRAHPGGTGHVFAWGQGLGAGLAVSAIARESALCDGVAVEDFFPSADHLMRRNGTAVIPDAVSAQTKLLRRSDEPHSAMTRLELPVFAILIGPGAGQPGDPVDRTLRLNRGRTDRWLRPGVTPPPPTPGPAQIDSISAWFKRWTAFPPIQPRTPRNPRAARK